MVSLFFVVAFAATPFSWLLHCYNLVVERLWRGCRGGEEDRVFFYGIGEDCLLFGGVTTL
jgi:hypothetical protein